MAAIVAAPAAALETFGGRIAAVRPLEVIGTRDEILAALKLLRWARQLHCRALGAIVLLRLKRERATRTLVDLEARARLAREVAQECARTDSPQRARLATLSEQAQAATARVEEARRTTKALEAALVLQLRWLRRARRRRRTPRAATDDDSDDDDVLEVEVLLDLALDEAPPSPPPSPPPMKREREEPPQPSRDLIRTLMRSMCDTPLYRDARKLNGERGAALLAKMRTGSQTLSDLEDPHALWGYVNAVGAKRAYNVCETFGWLWAHDLGAVLRTERSRSLCVASVGGGPGCCLLGWAVFERLTLAAAAGSADAPPRLHVFDYAPGWAPLVERAAAALGEPVGFAGCELTEGLAHASNAALRAAAAGLDVILLVYALHESDHDRPGIDGGRPPRWKGMLLDLWDAAKPSTLFLIKDQGWVEALARELLERERPGTVDSCVVPRAEGVRAAAHDSDGVFLVRRGSRS